MRSLTALETWVETMGKMTTLNYNHEKDRRVFSDMLFFCFPFSLYIYIYIYCTYIYIHVYIYIYTMMYIMYSLQFSRFLTLVSILGLLHQEPGPNFRWPLRDPMAVNDEFGEDLSPKG